MILLREDGIDRPGCELVIVLGLREHRYNRRDVVAAVPLITFTK
jgi:hypothetical protein